MPSTHRTGHCPCENARSNLNVFDKWAVASCPCGKSTRVNGSATGMSTANSRSATSTRAARLVGTLKGDRTCRAHARSPPVPNSELRTYGVFQNWSDVAADLQVRETRLLQSDLWTQLSQELPSDSGRVEVPHVDSRVQRPHVAVGDPAGDPIEGPAHFRMAQQRRRPHDRHG